MSEEEWSASVRAAFIKVCGTYDPMRPMTRELTTRVFQEVKKCTREEAERDVEQFMREHPGLKFLQVH
jgi:hypothetical protein